MTGLHFFWAACCCRIQSEEQPSFFGEGERHEWPSKTGPFWCRRAPGPGPTAIRRFAHPFPHIHQKAKFRGVAPSSMSQRVPAHPRTRLLPSVCYEFCCVIVSAGFGPIKIPDLCLTCVIKFSLKKKKEKSTWSTFKTLHVGYTLRENKHAAFCFLMSLRKQGRARQRMGTKKGKSPNSEAIILFSLPKTKEE